MNCNACYESIILTLCNPEIPAEILEIIVNYMLIPANNVVKTKDLCFCGEPHMGLYCIPHNLCTVSGVLKYNGVILPFLFRDITAILSKYTKGDVVSDYDFDRIILLRILFSELRFYKITYFRSYKFHSEITEILDEKNMSLESMPLNLIYELILG